MHRLWRLISLLSGLALLTGCGLAGAGTVSEVRLVCPQGWRTIKVSKDDKLTEPTAQAIEGGNEARRAAGCQDAAPVKPAPAGKAVS